MHYSQKLKLQIRGERAKLEIAYKMINEFRGHLQSEKFHMVNDATDTAIQVGDVHRYLDTIVNAIRGYPEDECRW